MTHTDAQVKEALDIVLQAFVEGSPALEQFELQIGSDQQKVNAIVYQQNKKDNVEG